MVFEANTRNKTEHTMLKGIKTVPVNGVFSCAPVFEVTLGVLKDVHLHVFRLIPQHIYEFHVGFPLD